MPIGVSSTYLDVVAGIKEVMFYVGSRPTQSEYKGLRPKEAPSAWAIRHRFPGMDWSQILDAVLGPPRRRRL